MKTRPQETKGSWYQTNADIIKKYIWSRPFFAYLLLQRVVKLVMDDLVKIYPKNMRLPIYLIEIYDKVEKDLKQFNPLVGRIKLYSKYSAKLYTYIETFLGKGKANAIFINAKAETLLETKVVIFKHNEGAIRAIPIFCIPIYIAGSASSNVVFTQNAMLQYRCKSKETA